MKNWKKPLLVLLILVFGAILVQAQTSSQFLANGFQALVYHAMRIEESFPGVNALGMALEEFDKAAKGGDSSGEAVLMMGMIYQHLNRPGTALGYYLEFAQSYPEEIWIYPLIGDLYAEMGRLDDAVEYYHKALANETEEQAGYAKAYFGLGSAALEKGDYLKAKEAYEMALVDAIDYLDARLALGKTLYHLEEFEEAVEMLEFAQLQAPRSISVLHYLGLSYQALGRTEQAEHAFQRMAELEKSQ